MGALCLSSPMFMLLQGRYTAYNIKSRHSPAAFADAVGVDLPPPWHDNVCERGLGGRVDGCDKKDHRDEQVHEVVVDEWDWLGIVCSDEVGVVAHPQEHLHHLAP